jgi:hypothetical protein
MASGGERAARKETPERVFGLVVVRAAEAAERAGTILSKITVTFAARASPLFVLFSGSSQNVLTFTARPAAF